MCVREIEIDRGGETGRMRDRERETDRLIRRRCCFKTFFVAFANIT